jgi:hypothetical protein
MKKQLIVLLLAVVGVFIARPGWGPEGPDQGGVSHADDGWRCRSR